jgi:3-hydroxyisobutyrate dehydrogenase
VATTVGFIGIGAMGRPMVENLAKAGFAVQSYDRNGRGNRKSAAAAAKGADVLITMLPGGEAVREAVLEALPALARGTIVVDMSSAEPAGTRALGAALEASGIEFMDAPVSGAVAGAKSATLAIMVGGTVSGLARVLPILKAMGNQIFHVGPLGAGHAVKALNNYLGAAGALAGFEALLVARAFGLDPKPMLDAINSSTGRNSATDRKIPRHILTGNFASGFKLALMTKDVGIAAELARGLRVEAPFLKQTLKMWRDAEKKLPAGADHVEIYKYQQKLSKGRSRRSAKPASRRKRRAAK